MLKAQIILTKNGPGLFPIGQSGRHLPAREKNPYYKEKLLPAE
jgi:hypothetical protein